MDVRQIFRTPFLRTLKMGLLWEGETRWHTSKVLVHSWLERSYLRLSKVYQRDTAVFIWLFIFKSKINQILVTYDTPAECWLYWIVSSAMISNSNTARESSKSDQKLIQFHFELKKNKNYWSNNSNRPKSRSHYNTYLCIFFKYQLCRFLHMLLPTSTTPVTQGLPT